MEVFTPVFMGVVVLSIALGFTYTKLKEKYENNHRKKR